MFTELEKSNIFILISSYSVLPYKCHINDNDNQYDDDDIAHKIILCNTEFAIDFNIEMWDISKLLPDSETSMFTKLDESCLLEFQYNYTDTITFLAKRLIYCFTIHNISIDILLDLVSNHIGFKIFAQAMLACVYIVDQHLSANNLLIPYSILFDYTYRINSTFKEVVDSCGYTIKMYNLKCNIPYCVTNIYPDFDTSKTYIYECNTCSILYNYRNTFILLTETKSIRYKYHKLEYINDLHKLLSALYKDLNCGTEMPFEHLKHTEKCEQYKHFGIPLSEFYESIKYIKHGVYLTHPEFNVNGLYVQTI
jgi:hypothetical protein